MRTVADSIGEKLNVRDGAIVVPANRNEFNTLVRILDDAYLSSLLDGKTVYLSTSKRPVKKAKTG